MYTVPVDEMASLLPVLAIDGGAGELFLEASAMVSGYSKNRGAFCPMIKSSIYNVNFKDKEPSADVFMCEATGHPRIKVTKALLTEYKNLKTPEEKDKFLQARTRGQPMSDQNKQTYFGANAGSIGDVQEYPAADQMTFQLPGETSSTVVMRKSLAKPQKLTKFNWTQFLQMMKNADIYTNNSVSSASLLLLPAAFV
eukprot:GHVT01059091.1.p1 GENE.GHVT01059091.1~~GHVT01059091.1.p1  ORF type:complete len:197 (-),score=25.81 GHVT01059091.1:1924-2514(-)